MLKQRLMNKRRDINYSTHDVSSKTKCVPVSLMEEDVLMQLVRFGGEAQIESPKALKTLLYTLV